MTHLCLPFFQGAESILSPGQASWVPHGCGALLLS